MYEIFQRSLFRSMITCHRPLIILMLQHRVLGKVKYTALSNIYKTRFADFNRPLGRMMMVIVMMIVVTRASTWITRRGSESLQ